MPKTGVWRVSFSLRYITADNKVNDAWLYHNGDRIPESYFDTHMYKNWLAAMGGRELLLQAEEGDSISLRSGKIGDHVDNGFYNILTCVEFKAI